MPLLAVNAGCRAPSARSDIVTDPRARCAIPRHCPFTAPSSLRCPPSPASLSARRWRLRRQRRFDVSRPAANPQQQQQGIEEDRDGTSPSETVSTDGAGDEMSVEEATKRWGLEFGLFKAMTGRGKSSSSSSSSSASSSENGGGPMEGASRADQAKELLKKYGVAYLVTSISFAAVSFALCYALVSAGVDVAALLKRLGIEVSGASEVAGTAAIAYAAHKAASPIRFPPTVALTPVVAEWLGRNKDGEGKEDGAS